MSSGRRVSSRRRPISRQPSWENTRPWRRERTNTTIAVVATDADLTRSQSQRMAVAAHDGLARAIVPSHTPFDGDLVFAAASGTAKPAIEDTDMAAICHAASICLARAVARGIRHAKPEPGDLLPCWSGS